MWILIALFAFGAVTAAHGLESAASINFNTDDSSIVNVISTTSQGILGIVSKQQACAAKGMVYSPATASADTGGCIDTNIGRCGKVGKIYAPNDATKDSNGCIIFPTYNLPICPNGQSVVADSSGNWVCGAIQ